MYISVGRERRFVISSGRMMRPAAAVAAVTSDDGLARVEIIRMIRLIGPDVMRRRLFLGGPPIGHVLERLVDETYTLLQVSKRTLLFLDAWPVPRIGGPAAVTLLVCCPLETPWPLFFFGRLCCRRCTGGRQQRRPFSAFQLRKVAASPATARHPPDLASAWINKLTFHRLARAFCLKSGTGRLFLHVRFDSCVVTRFWAARIQQRRP
jgi:hypothetical protein